MEELRKISQLSAEFPQLGAFLDGLEPVFQSWPAFRDRVHAGFLGLEPRILRRALQDLEFTGTPTPIDPRNARQIISLWESSFFRLFLDSVGFYPPAGANPAAALLPPATGIDEAAEREQRLLGLYGAVNYWKVNLQRTYPEVFLPLDPSHPEAPLQGCDLACCWGRGALALRGRSDRRIHCCDHSLENLRSLRRFVDRSGAGRNVTTHRCDIARLPFADNSLDFTIALDLFELLTDDSLDRVLLELLRCNKPGAAVYCKVTLHARAPALGQVQYFTRDHAIAVLTRPSNGGKRFHLQRSDPRLAEHFSLRVVRN